MFLNCGAEENSWESLGLQGDPTSPSKRRSVLNIHWKDWCWSWNPNTLATWCEERTHWERHWCSERLKAGAGDGRRWDGWMASPTGWTWVWVNCGIWWWTGRPGILQSMGSQRTDTTERLNWPDWTFLCSVSLAHGALRAEAFPLSQTGAPAVKGCSWRLSSTARARKRRPELQDGGGESGAEREEQRAAGARCAWRWELCPLVSGGQEPYKVAPSEGCRGVCALVQNLSAGLRAQPQGPVNSLRPHEPARLLCPEDSPGEKARVGCHSFLQGGPLTPLR